MRRVMVGAGLACVLVGLLVVQRSSGDTNCRTSTPAIEHMTVWPVQFETGAHRRLSVQARIADEPSEQRAGFQYVCGATIAKHPILFVFRHPYSGTFHMRNCYAPIDIAFMDAEGRIMDIQHMVPNSRHYGPPRPATYALEAEAGFFANHNLAAGKGRMRVESLGMLQPPTH
jgi:uncharacterized membrane protein (UPF0127 family)